MKNKRAFTLLQEGYCDRTAGKSKVFTHSRIACVQYFSMYVARYVLKYVCLELLYF